MSTFIGKKSQRFYYLDAIRIFCLSFVFIFHCFKIFDADYWYIKNPEILNVKTVYIHEFGLALMPCFFVISGASIWFSMQKRSGVVFLQNIFKRFFLPLLIGLTLLAIPQVYFEKVSKGEFTGSIISFIPSYFNDSNFVWSGLHLWFMILLFVYSIILIPFFSLGNRWLPLPLFQRILKSPFVLVLLAFLLVAPGWKVHPNSWMGNVWGGWNLFQNLIFLASGFALFSQPIFIENCKKYKWAFFVVALTLTLTLVYTYQDVRDIGFRSPHYLFRLFVKGIACWGWISAVLGIAAQYFNSNTRFISYWSIAAMPFYILSQPIIITVGFYVVQWPISILSKFCIITISSFVFSIILFELIKRHNTLRWLFGIPAKTSVQNIRKRIPDNFILNFFYTRKRKESVIKIPFD